MILHILEDDNVKLGSQIRAVRERKRSSSGANVVRLEGVR